MSTIDEIAKKAHVSTSTVSKALNNYNDISKSTKEKILEIAKKINYPIVNNAKNSQSKNSNNIGFILSGVRDQYNDSSNLFSMYIGAVKTCQKYGYELVILSTDSVKQTTQPLQELCDKYNLIGFVIFGLKISDTYYNEMLTLKLPCAAIDLNMILPKDDDMTNDMLSIITIDTQSAIDNIINLLYQKNHKNIAFINGSPSAEISIVREQAFIKAMKSKNLEVNEQYIRYGDFSDTKAYEEAKYLLMLYPEITAIFCVSDGMALGVYKAAKKLSRKIPEDIAIIGFDGIPIGEYLSPKLTTIKQNFKAMSIKAFENVIEKINGQKTDKICIVPYQFLIKESV